MGINVNYSTGVRYIPGKSLTLSMIPRKHEGEFRERNQRNPRETPTPREANLPSRESSTGTPTTMPAAVLTTSNASLPLDSGTRSTIQIICTKWRRYLPKSYQLLKMEDHPHLRYSTRDWQLHTFHVHHRDMTKGLHH